MARDRAAADNRMAGVQVLASFGTSDVSFTFNKPTLVATRAIIL
jgi:hypothetical protein